MKYPKGNAFTCLDAKIALEVLVWASSNARNQKEKEQLRRPKKIMGLTEKKKKKEDLIPRI